jgi:hypothetical protein
MTTQGKSLEELGRRAVACKHWRWMDGMTVHGLPTYRVVSNNCDGHTYRTDGYDSDSLRDCVPDLSDPATLGCLLALVRKAWGRPFWVEGDPRSMGERPDEWIGVLFEGRFATCPIVHASTEAEALVAALEAAP